MKTLITLLIATGFICTAFGQTNRTIRENTPSVNGNSWVVDDDSFATRSNDTVATSDSVYNLVVALIASGQLSAADVKTMYESNGDTNAFTDALLSKLSAIEAGAEVNLSGTETVALLDAHFGGTDWRTQDGYEANTDNQTAAQVPFTPNGTIAATTVQAAIQEVRDEAGAGGGEAFTVQTVTASATQTQAGGTALTETYIRVTLGDAADAVTLKEAAANTRQIVSNQTATTKTIFPAVGDDLGNGLEQPVVLSAGATATFIGLDATSWDMVLGAIPDDTTIELASDALQVKDDGITLAKLAGGTANYIFATDGSGDPTLIDKNTVGGISELVDSWPPSAPVVGKTYVLNGDGEERTYFDTATYSLRSDAGTSWVDGNAPLIASAEIEANGDFILITPSEPLVLGVDPDTGFDLDGESATDISLTYDSMVGSARRYALGSTVFAYESAIDLDFTQVGDGLQDSSGNALATFTNFTPINNLSTQFAYIINEDFTAANIPADSGSVTWSVTNAVTFPGGYVSTEFANQIFTVNFPPQSDFWFHTRMYVNGLASGTVLRLKDAGGDTVSYLGLSTGSPGPFTWATTGETGGVSAYNYASNVWFNVWIHYVTNGDTTIYIRSSPIRPTEDSGSGTVLTVPAGSVDITRIDVNGRGASRVNRWDEYRLATQEIGDNP